MLSISPLILTCQTDLWLLYLFLWKDCWFSLRHKLNITEEKLNLIYVIRWRNKVFELRSLSNEMYWWYWLYITFALFYIASWFKIFNYCYHLYWFCLCISVDRALRLFSLRSPGTWWRVNWRWPSSTSTSSPWTLRSLWRESRLSSWMPTSESPTWAQSRGFTL